MKSKAIFMALLALAFVAQGEGVSNGDMTNDTVSDGETPVPLESAVGYFVTSDGATNTAACLDSLFEGAESAIEAGLFAGTPEVVILGRDADGLNRDVVVASPFVLRGEDGAFLAPTESSHLVVTNGGELTIRNLVIGDRTGNTYIRIANRGALTLGAGAVITNLVCTGNITNLVCTGNMNGADAGSIAVMTGGTLRLAAGSAIVGCSASGTGSGGRHGGGVYVDDQGTIDLAGGTITKCRANSGGGIYAKPGANIIVSGASIVSGNTDSSTSNNGASDVYLVYAPLNINMIRIVKSVAGGSIGVRYSDGKGTAANFVFASASALSRDIDREMSAQAFFNDANASRIAVADSGGDIKWVDTHINDSGVPQPITKDDPATVAEVLYPDGSTLYWARVQDAFASLANNPGMATVTLLKGYWFDSTNIIVAAGCNVTFKSDATSVFPFMRLGDGSIIVRDGASLTVKNVELSDVLREDGVSASEPFFKVEGGELVLDGAKVSEIVAGGRFGSAVTVSDGGMVKLRNNAIISECVNGYVYGSDRTAYAGAILADGYDSDGNSSKVILEDCSITNCFAQRVGGVCAANGAVVEVSGAANIVGNEYNTEAGGDANITVALSSLLWLTDVLTGSVGVRRDVGDNRPFFGRVANSFSGSDADLVRSAMKFTSDDTGDYGVAVRTSDKKDTLLVWLGKLDASDKYTDEEKVYSLVKSPDVPFPVNSPTAETGLVYNGEEQVGVVAGRGYTLSGVTSATAAGSYSARVELASGYIWADGSTAAKTITWSIAKSTYDMSGISFEDATFVYDGEPHELEISGTLPDGVSVEYAGNGETEIGVYTVTASFTGDSANYNLIPDLKATLTIRSGDEPEPPSPPTPAVPTGIDFTAIADDASGVWTLTLTSAVERCWYSLYETNSLMGGFKIGGVKPVELRQAKANEVPEMIFTRPTNGGQFFWRVVAEPEDAH